MTIKKPMKTAATAQPVQAGGATIASRLQLDTSDAGKSSVSDEKASTVAVIVGAVALAIAGVLTYVLYQHWDFLIRA